MSISDWSSDVCSSDLFLIGCSFSFEEALVEDGIPLRHIDEGTNVPMYRTSIQTQPAGPFRGPLVVSMRPLKPADAIRAVQITRSEERRVGKASVSTCSSRWSPYHSKKTHNKTVRKEEYQ